MRSIIFHEDAFSEMMNLTVSSPKQIIKVIKLIADIQKTPFEGLGKPEALNHEYKGLWSRRISDKNRLIYDVTNDAIIVLSVSGHYKDK